MRIAAAFLLALLMVACAAGNKPVGSATGPTVAEAVSAPDRFPNARVRWGGTVVGLENRADSTWIEVIAYELTEEGRPKPGTASEGRFLARVPGFLDPEVYTRGRELSVSGVLATPTVQAIGDYAYRYPVVDVERHHLWPRPVVHTPASPYFYDPWYPFRPWPYYRPYWPYWP